PMVPNPTSTPSSGTAVLNDSATLTGGADFLPGDTITFYLMGPGSTASTSLGSAVYTDVVTGVTGDVTYSTATDGDMAGGYPTTTAGTYQWVVVYSGDGNNNGVTSPFGNEPWCVTASPVTITGTKFDDVTGNGFSSDDTGLGGVTIDLYQGGSGPSGTPYATTTTSSSNGTYSFTNLPGGFTYYVEEVVPSGYVQTGGGPNGSAGATYYTIASATAGKTYGGNNFDDADQCDLSDFTCVKYVLNGCTTVSDLRGNTKQGETVKVTFTYNGPTPHDATLVSYTAPGSTFDASTADQQKIYQEDFVTMTKDGTYCLTVTIPNCYYQIDFVCGDAIDVLGNPNAGADQSNIFYTPQSRLISADNGGTCMTAPGVGAGGFATIGFWHNKNGQAVIDSFNGGSTQKELGTWLATNFPNLFGASNPYTHESLAGLTNAQVAAVYENLWSPSGVTKNTYVQAFAVALGAYADDSSLGYDATAQKYGFKAVAGGGGGATYNVGSNGAPFGVANKTVLTVDQLLTIVNNNFTPSTGQFNSTDVSAFNSVLNGINTTGDITNADPVGAPAAGSGAVVYSSDQIRTAYGVNNLALDGTGQTIAIVDAYDNPSIFQSVDSFDSQMSVTTGGASLFTQYGSAASFLTVLGQDGTTSDLPATDPSGSWEIEEALDVEWIHAMAPGAQIIL
ncbi:MAG: SdrD B-like domain-containing protein, partial [Pirellulales bacterium]